MNPLEASIKLAAATNHDIYKLYSKAGDKNSPDGFVSSAYNTARMAMKEALTIQHNIERMRAVNDVTNTLYTAVIKPTGELLSQSQKEGRKNADEHLMFYQNNVPDKYDKSGAVDVYNGAITSIWTKINDQTVLAHAVSVGGLDEALVIGDDEHVGALRSSEIISSVAFWVAALYWDSFDDRVRSAPGGDKYSKQVVATMDNRVTDCCLRAHGQVQPFDTKFQLTGYPRFADELAWTPFHWYCRTSVALYQPQFDDGFTDRLIDSAKTVLSERERGIFKARHPADAFV